jgi:hypothetical protein
MNMITRLFPFIGSAAGGAGAFVRVSARFAYLLPALLLAACAHQETRDLRLRQQVLGTWSQGDSAEVTFLPDGSFHSLAKSGTNDAKYDGTWDIRSGVLIISAKPANEQPAPGAPNAPSASDRPGPTRHMVVSVNARHLTVLSDDFLIPQSGAKTNVWKFE